MDQDPRMTLNHIIEHDVLTHRFPRQKRGHGVLTKTIVHSSVTKGVFPARIRRKKKSDVLFVQDNHVQLKSLTGARLRTVALKNDFDSNIAAAIVIGRSDQRENSPDSDPSVMDGSGSTMEVDVDQGSTFPANILVLVLKDRLEEKLMFMFARDEPHGEVNFITSTFPLPAAKQPAERLGAYIAVDPTSSAMALAAQAGYVRFYALKTCEQLTAEFRGAKKVKIDNWTPVMSETMIQVGGIILKMDFVFPPREVEHANFLFLVFLVAVDDRTQLQLYEWDNTTPAHKIKLIATHLVPSPWKDSVPSLLIPLTVPCSVMLTYENDLGTLIFWGIHQLHLECQRAAYTEQNVEDRVIDEAPQSGESRIQPVWSAWTRPPRRDDYRKDQDCFFLAREDGLVCFIQVHENSRQTHRFFVSRLGQAIDAGFAAMDSGGNDSLNGRSDIIIIPGNMSDGGLYRYLPRLPVEPLDQKLNNWSFSVDWTVVPNGPKLPTDPRQHVNHEEDRIFMCSGKGKDHGKLLEIRSGTEAHTISTFRFEQHNPNEQQSQMELDSSLLVEGLRPTGLWLLPSLDPAKPFDPAVLLLSYPGYPGHTRFYCLDDETKIDLGGREDLLDLLIDTEASTLAVALTSDEIAIQITENAVRAITARAGGDQKTEKMNDLGKIAKAYIDGVSSTFVLALSGANPGLLYGSVDRAGDGRAQIHVLGSAVELTDSPGYSAVHLCKIGNSTLILAGTLSGVLIVYTLDHSAGSLIPVSTFPLPGVESLCESICLLRHSSRGSGEGDCWDCIVLCGLRNGRLQILQLGYGDECSYTLESLPQQITVGDPAVYVLPDHTTQRTHASIATSAIVVCQDTVLRLSFNSPDKLHPVQHRIWTPRLESINAPQGPIFAIGQFESWLDEAHALSKVFCYIDQQAIHLISVDESKTDNLVPQQLKLSGTPSRILYSAHLGKLIVGFAKIIAPDLLPDAPPDIALPRMVFPMLTVVDPDGPECTEEESQDGVQCENEYMLDRHTVAAGKSGERIMALLEWIPRVKDKRWPLLVVGSERTIEGGKARIGVLSIYNLKTPSEPGGRCKLEKKKEFRKDSPVYAVAKIGESSLVCGQGQVLEIVHLSETSTGLSLSPTASLQLRSDIRAISTFQDQIFVSTSHHSHVVCQWTGDELVIKTHDSQVRSGQDHIYLDGPRLLLGSDLESRICGLDVTEAKEPGEIKLELAFEISMLSPILRFHRASPRRPKTQGSRCSSNTIIGAALNGSLHTFDILSFEQWQLLRFIQDTAQRNQLICPATYQSSSREQASVRRVPADKHINGDVLLRLIDRQPSGAVFLRHLIREGTSGPMHVPADGQGDLRNEEARDKHFQHLASQAFSDVPPYNAYERVIGYLREVLRPIQ